jgi:hypothetical protein
MDCVHLAAGAVGYNVLKQECRLAMAFAKADCPDGGFGVVERQSARWFDTVAEGSDKHEVLIVHPAIHDARE